MMKTKTREIAYKSIVFGDFLRGCQHFVRHFGLIFRILPFYETHQHVFLEPNKKFDLAIKIKSFFFFQSKNTRTSFCSRTRRVWFVFFMSLFKMKHDFQMVLCHFMQYAIVITMLEQIRFPKNSTEPNHLVKMNEILSTENIHFFR